MDVVYGAFCVCDSHPPLFMVPHENPKNIHYIKIVPVTHPCLDNPTRFVLKNS